MHDKLFNKSMVAVLIAQFLSALADNTLFFVLLAQIKLEGYPDWTQPILQATFIASYILCAPFVGAIADSFAKGRVMVLANSLKLLGTVGLFVGLNPFVCYALVGVGATIYSPAKFGILGEITHGDQLVKANGLIESSTIVAIVIGTGLGGWLTDWSLLGALILTLAVYALAVIANLFIPKLQAAHPASSWRPSAISRDFFHSLCVLFKNTDARFAIIGTSLFWGAGTTLRLLLFVWVPVALNNTQNAMPGYLMGLVSIGIVIGAAIASFFITVKQARQCLIAGFCLGLFVTVMSLQQTFWPIVLCLICLGACGGFFIVPLNALLQIRGRDSVGAGHAIAVQNFSENIAMIAMLSFYAMASVMGLNVIAIVMCFGLFFSISIVALAWFSRQQGHTSS